MSFWNALGLGGLVGRGGGKPPFSGNMWTKLATKAGYEGSDGFPGYLNQRIQQLQNAETPDGEGGISGIGAGMAGMPSLFKELMQRKMASEGSYSADQAGIGAGMAGFGDKGSIFGNMMKKSGSGFGSEAPDFGTESSQINQSNISGAGMGGALASGGIQAAQNAGMDLNKPPPPPISVTPQVSIPVGSPNQSSVPPAYPAFRNGYAVNPNSGHTIRPRKKISK